MTQTATKPASKSTRKKAAKPATKVASKAHAKPPAAPAPKTKNLAQQKADFTAEGSPPPGKVDTMPPVTEETTSKGVSPAFTEKTERHPHASSGKDR